MVTVMSSHSETKGELSHREKAKLLCVSSAHLSLVVNGKRASEGLAARHQDLIERSKEARLTLEERRKLFEIRRLKASAKILRCSPDRLEAVVEGHCQDRSVLSRYRK